MEGRQKKDFKKYFFVAAQTQFTREFPAKLHWIRFLMAGASMGPPMSVGDRVIVDGMAGEIAFLGASFVPRSSHVLPCASCPLRIYACVCVCMFVCVCVCV